jgi:hypothetical protein
MSWDVILMRCDRETVAEMNDEDVPPPLGPAATGLSHLMELLPELDFTDPTWGTSTATETRSNSTSEMVTRSIRSCCTFRGGDGAIRGIEAEAAALGAKALDTSAGEFMKFGPSAAESLRLWRAYRDTIVRKR